MSPILEPGAPPDYAHIAISAWNAMGSELNWTALPLICELFGVVDVPLLLRQLFTIREHVNRNRNNA